ncbi:MAG: hypothetical protein AAF085_16785, partial [Planctomycetota bacterium]
MRFFGSVKVGETITVDTSGIVDDNGLSNAIFSYQWVLDGSPLPGETNDSYTLTSGHEGSAIGVVVSYNDDDGNLTESIESSGFTVHEATFGRYLVNSLRDFPDASPSDGVAATAREDHPYAVEVTLRAAIEHADALASTFAAAGVTQEIVFADHLTSGQTIQLMGSQLTIGSDLRIVGPGNRHLVIDANASETDQRRAIEVQSGAVVDI